MHPTVSPWVLPLLCDVRQLLPNEVWVDGLVSLLVATLILGLWNAALDLS